MGAFQDYPKLTTMEGSDLILFWDSSNLSVKAILFEDLISAINDSESAQTTVTSDETLTTSDRWIVGDSAVEFEVTLCEAASRQGKPTYFANKGDGDMIVAAGVGDAIYNGSSSVSDFMLEKYESCCLVPSFGVWHVMGPVSTTPP